MIDGDDRGAGARERTIELLERDAAVGGRLSRAHAEASLARHEHVASAARQAGQPRADAHDAAAGLAQAELGIVAGDAPDLAPGNAQVGRDRVERRRREPALGALHHLQRRQEPRPLTGKLRQRLESGHFGASYHADFTAPPWPRCAEHAREAPRLAGVRSVGAWGALSRPPIYSPSRNVRSVGPHLAHSGPLATWPSSVSISKYVACTPALVSWSITPGASEGGKSLSVRDST